MKPFYFIIIVLSAFVVSCSKPTKEELIEKAFKEYVNKNFDDPNNLKEIVSIESRDTAKIALQEITKSILELDSLLLYYDSIYNSPTALNKMVKDLSGYENQFSNLGYYERDKIKNAGYEYINCALKLTLYNKSNYRKKVELVDSTLNTMIIPQIILYEIRARVRNNDELKLNKYYALTDSIDIKIYEKEPRFEDYSSQIGEFKEIIDNCLEEQLQYKQLIDNATNKMSEFKELCRNSGIFI